MNLFEKWVESLDFEYEVLPTCARNISLRSTCEKCHTSCDQQAISILNGKPEIDHDKCTECGKCISACPLQAIGGIYPKRIILGNKLLATEKNIPTVKELLILYKKGIREIVGEDLSLLEKWEPVVSKANEILEKLGERSLTITKKSISEEECISRREFFALWRKQSQSVIKEVTPAKWRFNQNDFDLSRYYKDYQFARIKVDIEKCTLCKACEKLCNKKCFHIEEDTFKILPQTCSSCRVCVDACPEKSIFVEEYISKKEETVFPIYHKNCTVCHNTFITLREQDHECPACIAREKFNHIIKG